LSIGRADNDREDEDGGSQADGQDYSKGSHLGAVGGQAWRPGRSLGSGSLASDSIKLREPGLGEKCEGYQKVAAMGQMVVVVLVGRSSDSGSNWS
jgi:hypothetical protein